MLFKRAYHSSQRNLLQVNVMGSCDMIAPSAPRHLQFLSDNVTEKMKDNHKKYTHLKWQYMANFQGVMTIYPAFRLSRCAFIDPRFR